MPQLMLHPSRRGPFRRTINLGTAAKPKTKTIEFERRVPVDLKPAEYALLKDESALVGVILSENGVAHPDLGQEETLPAAETETEAEADA